MRQLEKNKRVQILNMLLEGSSVRAIARIMDVSINTVMKLQLDVGEACDWYFNRKVRGLICQRIECDEIWAFCYARQRKALRVKGEPEYYGDVWLWTALQRETRLIISWMLSPNRDTHYAREFAQDLASRVSNRPQITTDGNAPYRDTIVKAFGGEVDFAQIVKVIDSTDPDGKVESKKTIVSGEPRDKYISTSHMERHNLTTRMCLRRYTRDTNAHSKKYQNHYLSVAAYMVWYNFVRVHSSIGKTPAMAAKLASKPYTLEWMLNLIDALAATRKYEAMVE